MSRKVKQFIFFFAKFKAEIRSPEKKSVFVEIARPCTTLISLLKNPRIMIEIDNKTYAEIARLLRDEIGDADYFNGSIDYDTDEFYSTLTTTSIIFRTETHCPDGVFRPITDVIPLWWEFTTTQATGETLNDFSFSELKPYLLD